MTPNYKIYSKEQRLAWADEVLWDCCKECEVWRRWFHEHWEWGPTMVCSVPCDKPDKAWRDYEKKISNKG